MLTWKYSKKIPLGFYVSFQHASSLETYFLTPTLPIHILCVESKECPGSVHSHLKLPGLLTQIPFIHWFGLWRHSSTSEKLGTILFIHKQIKHEHIYDNCILDLPAQTLENLSNWYPAGQIQWKLPGVFLHCPLSQIKPFSEHSLRTGKSDIAQRGMVRKKATTK